jgi:hypothetical protein
LWRSRQRTLYFDFNNVAVFIAAYVVIHKDTGYQTSVVCCIVKSVNVLWREMRGDSLSYVFIHKSQRTMEITLRDYLKALEIVEAYHEKVRRFHEKIKRDSNQARGNIEDFIRFLRVEETVIKQDNDRLSVMVITKIIHALGNIDDGTNDVYAITPSVFYLQSGVGDKTWEKFKELRDKYKNK